MTLTNTLGPSEITRLKELIDEGVKTQSEIESLREGITETVKAIAEELNIPAKLLKKAISTAHKGNFKEHEEELNDLERILQATGRK